MRLGIDCFLDLVREAAKSEHPIVCVDLPTGYGKSTASFLLLKEIYAGELGDYAERVIHVVPTRCLVEELVESARRRGLPAYGQCMYFTPQLKDPYFINPLMFSTIDSYTLNFFKVPVAEQERISLGRTLGHYDIPRYSAYTAINVLDEYHLLAPGDPGSEERDFTSKAWTSISCTVRDLLKAKAPVILETATPRYDALRCLKEYCEVESLYILSYDASSPANSAREGSKTVVNDRDFTDPLLSREYRTFIHSADGFPQKALDLCLKEADSKNMLIACNNIRSAVQVFQDLKEKGFSPILLHSQLTSRDKERKIHEIRREMERGNAIVVSTQVIEVGVNLDFDVMISDAAPITSLVQRIGRVGRSIDRQPIEHHAIHIVYDVSYERNSSSLYAYVYSLQLTRATIQLIAEAKDRGKEISWRIPASSEVNGRLPYNKIAEVIYQQEELRYDTRLSAILSTLLSPTVDARTAINCVRRLRSLVRDSIELPVLVVEELLEEGTTIPLREDMLIPAKPSTLGLQVDPQRIYPRDPQKLRSALQMVDNRLLAVVERERDEVTEVAAISLKELDQFYSKGYISREGRRLLFRALIARPDAYSSEEGFIKWL